MDTGAKRCRLCRSSDGLLSVDTDTPAPFASASGTSDSSPYYRFVCPRMRLDGFATLLDSLTDRVGPADERDMVAFLQFDIG